MEKLYWAMVGVIFGALFSAFLKTFKPPDNPLRGFYLRAYRSGKVQLVWNIELPYGDIPGNWHEVDFMEINRVLNPPEKKP